MRKLDKRDLHFFKYRIYGITYLKFYRALKKLGITFLIEHRDEFYFLRRYNDYGSRYLKFLNDAIELKIDEIVDMKNKRENMNSCILKWVFRNLNKERRSLNN